jgi:hypothetical protein
MEITKGKLTLWQNSKNKAKCQKADCHYGSVKTEIWQNKNKT